MKKIFILLILLISTVTFSVLAKTNDTTIRVDYLSNVYGNFKIGDLFYWNQIGLTYANEKLAYCIEPGKWINETLYDSFADFNIKGLNEQQKQQLELYAYYGYQYYGHQTIKYYLATQELIWRYLGITEMYWSTGAVHGGEKIDVETEKNTINHLIARHNYLPSFHNQTFDVISGHPLELIDTNNVFENFDIIGPVYHATSMSGNTLTIYPKKVGQDTINLLKYPNNYKPSFIYTKNNSQAVVTLGLSNKIYSHFNLNVKGYNLNIHKKDRLTNSNIPSGDGSLKGAIYKLTNNLDYEQLIETDEFGDGQLINIPADNYILKEIKASPGYQLDPNEYMLTINKNTSLEIEMDLYEDIITNEIELIKVFSSGETGIVMPEFNITFAIYDKNGNFIKEITTDQKGRAKTTLNYGTYTIRQVNTTPNYEKVDDFTVFIDENNGEPLEYILSDNIINSRVKINKIDQYNRPIKQAGVKFKIKNIDTGNYVTQKIIYPEEKIIDVFETDKNGTIITPYSIVAGNYQIEELEGPTGYLAIKEPIPFTINEDTIFDEDEKGKIVNINVVNRKPFGKVVINKMGKDQSWQIDSEGNYYIKDELKPLSKVEFDLISDEDIIVNDQVIYPKGTLIEKLITEEGTISSNLLPLGKYCVVETKSLPDYQIDNNKRCFELEYVDNETEIILHQLEIINRKIENRTIITKLGEYMTGIENNQGIYEFRPLKDVELGLFALDNIINDNTVIVKDSLIMSGVTLNDGKLILHNLPTGKYYIKELKADKQYRLNDKKYPFEINSNFNYENKIIIKNYLKKGNISIKKIDRDTKNSLSNAVFKLKNDVLRLEHQMVTNKEGIIKLDNIAYGLYTLNEEIAPIGYKKINVLKKLNIDDDEKMINLEISNVKYDMPNTSTNTKIKLYFLGGSVIIGLLGFLLTKISRKKYYE